MPVLTKLVAASSDDVKCALAGVFVLNDPENLLGDFAPRSGHLTARFLGITIPQGSVIVSAILSAVCSTADGAANLQFVGKCQVADNGATFSTEADFLARTYTPGTIDAYAGALVVDTRYNLIDLVAEVQTVVNRPSWVAGNALVCVLFNFASVTGDRFYSWDANPAKAAQIDITYNAPTSWAGDARSNVGAAGPLALGTGNGI